MAVYDNLFDNGIREVLQTRITAYPLYVYCFNGIMNEILFAKLGDASAPGRSSEVAAIPKVNPPARKIRPYLLNLFRRKHTVGKVDVLFISRYRPAEVSGTQGLRADYLFNPVLNEICKGFSQLRMAMVDVGGQGKHYSDDRLDNFNVLDFLSFGLLFKCVFRSFSFYYKYKKMIKRLSNNQKDIFSGFFTLPSLLFSHLLDFCLASAIQSLGPKVIVANDDVLRFKPLTASNSKLIVLQSASMPEKFERYASMLFSGFLEDQLLSDYFCVSGPQAESVKQNVFKDTKRIIVTGQPRFDILARADESFDANRIRRKFGLAKDKKVMLLATDTHGQPVEENRESISAIYDAANSLRDTQLVVKLHPAEDQEAPLYKENRSYTPVVIKGSRNISELLYVCDAMITKSSTTTLEAAILNKPIIVLNLSGKPDVMPYVEKGIALGVYRKEDLIPAIKDALHNREAREKLARCREKFVYEYAYIQDGRASERVADLIKSVITQSKQQK
jgi:glycosyltransferase involved in cell wall biosynthesis